MPIYSYNPEDFTISIDGAVAYNAQDSAKILVDQLTPEQLEYAGMPARGEYRGFRALHDLTDANTFLPGVETQPLLEAVTDESVQAFWDSVIAFVDDLISEGTDGRKTVSYITIAAREAMDAMPDWSVENPSDYEEYENSYGDEVACMNSEREDYERDSGCDFTSDLISDDHFARFVSWLRADALLVEEPAWVDPQPNRCQTHNYRGEDRRRCQLFAGHCGECFFGRRMVWTLTVDWHNSGTETTSYGSEAQFHNALKTIMEERMSQIEGWKSLNEQAGRIVKLAPDDAGTTHIEQMRELIAAGKINEAWAVYRDDEEQHGGALHHPDDCFQWDSEEVDFGNPDADALETFVGEMEAFSKPPFTA